MPKLSGKSWIYITGTFLFYILALVFKTDRDSSWYDFITGLTIPLSVGFAVMMGYSITKDYEVKNA